MDRVDHHLIWSAQRELEGRKDYRGGIMWSEGEIRFKKDCTLVGSVPLPLAQLACPTDLERRWGTVLIATDAAKGTRVSVLQEMKRRVVTEGRLKPGGFISQMPSMTGYVSFWRRSVRISPIRLQCLGRHRSA